MFPGWRAVVENEEEGGRGREEGKQEVRVQHLLGANQVQGLLGRGLSLGMKGKRGERTRGGDEVCLQLEGEMKVTRGGEGTRRGVNNVE